MRPPVQTQAPHHFIRRWPKNRRFERKPETITKVIRLSETEVREYMLGSPIGEPHSMNKQAAYVMATMASSHPCPRGYNRRFGKMTKITYPDVAYEVEVIFKKNRLTSSP